MKYIQSQDYVLYMEKDIFFLKKVVWTSNSFHLVTVDQNEIQVEMNLEIVWFSISFYREIFIRAWGKSKSGVKLAWNLFN